MRTTAVFFLLLTTTAMAGPRQDMLAGIARCQAFADEHIFLDCVYGAAQPVRAELGLPPAPATQLRLVPQAMPGAPVSAPVYAPVTASAAPPPSHDSGFTLFGDGTGMTAYSFDKHGLFTVTLADGSVWKQYANDTNFAHFSGKPRNYSVSINTSDSGITRMTVRGEGGPYRVERVK